MWRKSDNILRYGEREDHVKYKRPVEQDKFKIQFYEQGT